MKTVLPDKLFLGAGAMKAGTTWMYRVFRSHPEIYFPPEKELHYFAHRYAHGPSPLGPGHRLSRAIAHTRIDPEHSQLVGVRSRLLWTADYLSDPIDDAWYSRLFRAAGSRWSADFSNLTCQVSEAGWREIRTKTGNLKVSFVMREPIDRLWSQMRFKHQLAGDGRPFDELGPRDAEAMLRPEGEWRHAEYGAIVRRMKAGLDPADLKLVFYEEMQADPAAFVRDMERFLGVAHHNYPADLLGQRVNETRAGKMPGWFVDMFAKDARRIGTELRDAGMTLPKSW
ncbi:sulfotransferase [Aurantimonas sp. 22II-16-19i]|uniref:sulfotransferase n=1 Tax=Aurantimonas sp. 22II-16-19i TaxID=1317114 RepID=UPI0009F7ED26|nr:sulfotransferase [Aurantimonas sp. 22II-16-19i]ORE91425.1 hypothetical protein ATO4_18884 [Aurantimonas sp. 22II-16-19i]